MPYVITPSMERLGFRFDKGRPHVGRSIMLPELEKLLTYKDSEGLPRTEYSRAIVEENCLGKRSRGARENTYKRLAQFYGLDFELAVFRALLFFWHRDESAHPLLALLCAYARDGILVDSAPSILTLQPGELASVDELIETLNRAYPGIYSVVTMKSIATRILSSWNQAGHLVGTTSRVRGLATPTPGSAAYAIFLGYLCGIRGKALLETEFTALLDATSGTLLILVDQAAEYGWLVVNQVGGVFEVLFPKLVSAEELV